MTNDFKTLFEEKCAECDQLKSEIEILKQDKESLESMVDELQELCDECSAETDRLTVSHEDLESKTFELEEQLERLKTTHGQQSSSYIEQIQCLNKDMIELKRTQVQLETQVEKLLRNERLLTNRADKAEKNLYDKAEEVVMLKSQLEDDREEYENKILRLNREMKDSEDNNRVLMMQLEKLSNVNNSIRDDPNLIPSDTRREEARKTFLQSHTLHALKQHFQMCLLQAKLSVAEVEPSGFNVLNQRYEHLWDQCVRENVPIDQFDAWILGNISHPLP